MRYCIFTLQSLCPAQIFKKPSPKISLSPKVEMQQLATIQRKNNNTIAKDFPEFEPNQNRSKKWNML